MAVCSDNQIEDCWNEMKDRIFNAILCVGGIYTIYMYVLFIHTYESVDLHTDISGDWG